MRIPPGHCLGLIASLFLIMTARAAPSAAPGDVALRHDIQILADYGAISVPVTTWPIAWDAVRQDLERVKLLAIELPDELLPTYGRLLAIARRETARGDLRGRIAAAGAEEPVLIRGFANTPREKGEIDASVSWSSDVVSLDLNLTAVDDPVDGDDVRLDGSQLGVELGNWTVAASTLDRWWGPGWDGSLILSNNARPIPALTIGRNLADAPEASWLSWLGPWDLEVIFGQLESDRAVPDARFFGMRFNFRLPGGVELGLSRTAQWCGEGRPCGWGTFWDLFVGKDNIGDAGTTLDNEPGNQMAGFDIRWTRFWFETPVSLYAQFIGEDEAGGFPSRYLAQIGIDGSGFLRDGATYRWFGEIAGTSCDVVKSEVLYNCAYRQSIYRSGYTYKGRIIGHGLDNDGRVVSAGAIVADSHGNTWFLLGRFGDLNRVGSDPNHTVSIDPADLLSIDLQHSRTTRYGRFDIGIGHERRKNVATGVESNDTRGFLRWQYDWGR